MNLRKIRIFLASPGDVAEERSMARNIIVRIADDPFVRRLADLEVVAWDDPAASLPMLANFTPQEAIARGLPLPSQCEIVVVIFWSRIGTPLAVETHGYRADGKPYQSGTEWEYLDAINVAPKNGKPLVIVYRREQAVGLSSDDPKFLDKVKQWEAVQSFFAEFRTSEGIFKRGYEGYQSPSDFAGLFERHLKALLGDLLGPKRLISAGIMAPAWDGTPFPGLRPFLSSEADLFFGRDRDVDRVLDLLRRSRFVAIIGASGSGKSSLIQAGVLPRLQVNAISDEHIGSQHWIPVVFSPGGNLSRNPIEALIDTLCERFPLLARDISGWPERRHKLMRDLYEDPSVLPSLCNFALTDRPAWAEVLFVVDQFEELFTVVAPEYRSKFVELLVQAAHAPRTRCLISLRSDFYNECLRFSDLTELMNSGHYALGGPNSSALFEIITKPASHAGLVFEQDLVDRLISDTGQQPGALALLAYALRELYERREKDGRMTFSAYESMERVQGAIGRHAEEIYTSLPETTRNQLWFVFRELVEVDEREIATRRSANLAQVASVEDARSIIEAFTQGRLLVQSLDSGTPTVEIAHEAVLQHWKRAADWIESRQADLRLLRQVRTAATEWNRSGQLPVFRWPDERLKMIYGAFARLGIDPARDLAPNEVEFIRPEVERLVEDLSSHALRHAQRSSIGERLSILGDPRRGVGLNAEGIPDIVWCHVPSGSIMIERLNRPIETPAFYISKYLITFAQFEAFMSATDGYNDTRRWYGLSCPRSHRQSPGEQRFKFSNYPRENASWYEAMAFCRWLSYQLGYEVELPTETQWQLAASAGNDSTFPWGDAWVAEYANTRDSGLSRTTAVGVYLQDAAVDIGALDLSGNVMEWCLNEFNDPVNRDYSGDEDRGVRGGAWNLNQTFARIRYRSGKSPIYRADNLGFRICTAQLPNGK